MSREILFKAKRVDNGEWVEGYLLKANRMDFIFPTVTNGSFDGLKNVMKFINPCFLVNSETICQYTGLTDKNGKKIWENDILRYSYDYEDSPWLKSKGLTNEDIKYYIGEVFWSDWRASWAVCGNGKSICFNQDVFKYNRNPNRTEVIGNVFDNPELLEN